MVNQIGEPINVFNHGKMIRDFTYVGDIVESIKRLVVNPVNENENWNTVNSTELFSFKSFQTKMLVAT